MWNSYHVLVMSLTENFSSLVSSSSSKTLRSPRKWQDLHPGSLIPLHAFTHCTNTFWLVCWSQIWVSKGLNEWIWVEMGLGRGLSQIMKAQTSDRNGIHVDMSIMGLICPQSLLLESTVTAFSVALDDVAIGKGSLFTRERRYCEVFEATVLSCFPHLFSWIVPTHCTGFCLNAISRKSFP